VYKLEVIKMNMNKIIKRYLMQDDSPIHHRRSTRLKGYDYTMVGAYFVTLVTWQRACLFGQVVDGKMHLNEMGEIVAKTWLETAVVRPNVELDTFGVMPNHMHGIIVINDPVVVASRLRPLGWRLALNREQPNSNGLISKSLGAIICQVKSIATKRINLYRQTPGNPVWQRNYYDHIIRDEKDLDAVRAYIDANPYRWAEDDYHH